SDLAQPGDVIRVTHVSALMKTTCFCETTPLDCREIPVTGLGYVVAATGEPGAAPGGQIVVALDAVPDRAEDLDDFPVDMSLARELSWTAVLDLPATAGAGNGEPSIRPLFGVMIDDEEVIPFVVGSGTNAHLTYPVLG